MNGESSKAKSGKKNFVQSKLYFSETIQSTKPTAHINKGKGNAVSHSVIPEKRKEPEPDTVHEKVDIPKRKKPNLKDMLLDENFEKLDEKHVYCHYCDTGKSITLHRSNDGDRLWTHLNTALHINNKEKADISLSKKVRTTFISQYVNIDYDSDSQHDDDLQCNINSKYKGKK